MEIVVDADACPVKEEIYRVAVRYGLTVVLVSNAYLHAPQDVSTRTVVVDKALDAADDWIAAHVQAGDVVVTADIPLAARCLRAGARVLGTDGRPFTEANIGSALAGRELSSHLRELNVARGGPRPLTQRARSAFLSRLDELAQQGLRERSG